MNRAPGMPLSVWVQTVRKQLLSDMSMNRDWIVMDAENALGLVAVLDQISEDVATLEARVEPEPQPARRDNVVVLRPPVRRQRPTRPTGGGDVA